MFATKSNCVKRTTQGIYVKHIIHYREFFESMKSALEILLTYTVYLYVNQIQQ